MLALIAIVKLEKLPLMTREKLLLALWAGIKKGDKRSVHCLPNKLGLLSVLNEYGNWMLPATIQPESSTSF